MGNTIACISETTSTSIALATMTFSTTTNGYDATCKNFCTSGANSYPYSAGRYTYPNGDTTQSATGIECACYDAIVQPTQYQPATNPFGQCANADFMYRSTTTTFGQETCYLKPNDLSGYLTVSSPAACFSRCAGQQFANILPDSSLNTFYCQCSQVAQQSSNSASCDKDILFSFFHVNYPQSSGLARKRGMIRNAAEKRSLVKADNEFCPAGMSACAMSRSVGDGYECIDTETELESCGGCIHGLYGLEQSKPVSAIGEDCTAVQGVPMGAMTCTEGRCVAMACEKGYTLVEGQCQSGRSKRV